MSSSAPHLRISPQHFLDAERRALHKSEYFDGEVYAMAGASEVHLSIGSNIIMTLGPALRKRSCKIYSSDMKVWIPATRSFVYPDLTIVCGGPKMRDEHRDVLENPLAIFEVLSPSTEKYDRTVKFDGYSSIETFTQYALIAQDEPRVEVFTRSNEGLWIFTRFTGLSSTAEFPALELSIPLASLYDRVDFPA